MTEREAGIESTCKRKIIPRTRDVITLQSDFMKQLDSTKLQNLMGGASENVCTALQNFANQFGSGWSDEQWDNWAKDFESLCMQ